MSTIQLKGKTLKTSEREVTVAVFETNDLGIRLHSTKHNYGVKFGITRVGAEILRDYLTKVLAGDVDEWEESSPDEMTWQVVIIPKDKP